MTLSQRIARIEELAGKATERPWGVSDGVLWHVVEGPTACCGNWIPDHNGEGLCCGNPVRESQQEKIAEASPEVAAFLHALANEALPVIRELGAKSDAEMERVKACEHIAEGDEGWPELRELCPSTAAVAKLRDENDKLKWQVRDTCARAERAEALLRECDEAMNPPDRGGISLDTWNQRIKVVTAKIRYLFQASEPVSRAALSPKGET